MKIFPIFIFIFCILFSNVYSGKFDNLVGTPEDYNQLVQVLPEKNLVFISGWPHSGTTITNVIFNNWPNHCSTMINKCVEKYYYCKSVNYEGQWLLYGLVADPYKSGKTCPIERSESVDHQIMQTFASFWDLKQDILIDKSPQNFAKMFDLLDIFKGAKSHKFLILLKHPITLSNFVPNKTWVLKEGLTEPQKIGRANKIVSTFINNMNKIQDKDCIEGNGWIKSFENLYEDLQKLPNSRDIVKIVRYEDFIDPTPVCIELIKFFLINVDINELHDFCRTFFPPASKLKKHKYFDNFGQRKLGLTDNHPNVTFSAKSLKTSLFGRLNDFNEFNKIDFNEKYKNELIEMNPRVRKIGYDIFNKNTEGLRQDSIFAPWYLIP